MINDKNEKEKQINDKLISFTLENSLVKGRIVKLNNSIDTIIKRHGYPRILSLIIAETLSITCCIGSTLKLDGIFTMQLNSKGIIKSIVADFTTSGELRCYANFNEKDIKSYDKVQNYNLQDLMSEGHLALTFFSSDSDKRYQGIVPIQDGSISRSTQYYFENSEQIDTEILCFAEILNGKWSSASIMIQNIPLNTINIETEKKAYNLSKVFLKSLTANEILSPINSMEDILYKLFNSFKIKIHKYLEIIEKCRCNLEKIEQTIKNISNEQIKDLIYEDGSLEIKCEFCKNTRKYLKSDLIRIRN